MNGINPKNLFTSVQIDNKNLNYRKLNNKNMENNFGGSWTENKIEIIVEYAKAYLTIMDSYAADNDWKLLYFDGFAGSGYIKKEMMKMKN